MADRKLIEELLDGPYPCALTTLRGDGSPYSVVVWCGRDGDRVTVNAAEGRWLENLRRDPRVSLVVVDTANILRHVGVDGRAVEIEPDEDYEHIDELSRVYLGGRYQWTTPEQEPRYRVVIEPDRVRTADIALPDREIR
jgi:PPOX class probable F420-dependent enzyme